jgi:long-subunit acyl-CoA synthetase (AMP-forming)
LRGRIKEMIVLSIGEKISPTVVESELTRDPLFAQAMVVGDVDDRGWAADATLKIRREAIQHLFAKDIAALYESRPRTAP